MHRIEPYNLWIQYYDSSSDDRSPFFGKEYNYNLYQDSIYGYYIDPAWDFIGSETLYVKVLFVDYEKNICILEFLGEWNDTLHNDIMHLKRNIIDHFIVEGINKFILIGENVYNFHGSDDCYYEEWFDEIDSGWISAVNFADHVTSEWSNFNVDQYINHGGKLDISNWRAKKPAFIVSYVNDVVNKRISLV